MELGENEEAINYFQEAIRLEPNSSEAHYNYGILLERLGRFKESKREFKTSSRLQAND
jgi:Flp pilus assembly protein TadD